MRFDPVVFLSRTTSIVKAQFPFVSNISVKMEKRCRPPQGYYKSLETTVLSRSRICDRKPDVLGVFEAEQIIAKKICNGKPFFMIKWQGYCSSQNTWEPKTHLPPELIEAFETPDLDPVRVEEAREIIGLVFERGMKVPLQYEESIETRHDVVHLLFPNLPASIQVTPTDICDQELHSAGLAPYMERTINANGNRCRIVQLTFRLLLSKSPTFYHEGKVSQPVERLRVAFRKQYTAVTL